LRPHLIPVIEPMDPRRGNVYEHTPLDYYKYGEYPRFIRLVGAHQPLIKMVWKKEGPAEASPKGFQHPKENTTTREHGDSV